jgi:hypothetical protein
MVLLPVTLFSLHAIAALPIKWYFSSLTVKRPELEIRIQKFVVVNQHLSCAVCHQTNNE